MDKKSSDEIASLASLYLDADPVINDAVADEAVAGVLVASSPLGRREAIRRALQPIVDDLKSLAGSVVSQADGPE